MVVEVANVEIPWTAPWDLDVRTMSFQINDRKRPAISSVHPGGANVVLGDASTRFLRESIIPGNLRALITIAPGAREITAEQVFPEQWHREDDSRLDLGVTPRGASAGIAKSSMRSGKSGRERSGSRSESLRIKPRYFGNRLAIASPEPGHGPRSASACPSAEAERVEPGIHRNSSQSRAWMHARL